MIPTDEQLNRAMAEALGWQERRGVWRTPGSPGDRHRPLPDYCGDRNALPEVWAALTGEGVRYGFITEVQHHAIRLDREDGGTLWQCGEWFTCATLPPRLHVIAALKALGRWPDDWSSE